MHIVTIVPAPPTRVNAFTIASDHALVYGCIMRTIHIAIASAVLLGCGDDGMGNIDAPTVPPMIMITGTATKRELLTTSPAAGATIGAYKTGSDATPVVTATTDAMGNYTLVVPTNGQPLDGYLKSTLAGFVDTYLYPPRVLTADFAGASMNILNQNTIDALNSFCQMSQDGTKGRVGLLVADAALMPVASAMVSSMPASGKYCYNGGSGTPSSGATMTAADGLAYLINAPAGEVTVSATATGMTFTAHKITVRTGVLTTTVIQP